MTAKSDPEFNLEDFEIPMPDLENLVVVHRDPRMREEPFDQLHQWLEQDRDRRSVVIMADNVEIWWAGLRIDQKVISAASGNDLDDVLDEILAGMVMHEPEGIPL